MSVPYYGDFAEDDTVNIPFNTFSSDDPSKSCTITELADADIKVYKDGNDAEIATDGATVVINFDSHTGAHMITIDTSADAAYSTGSEYAVLIDGTVIDAATDMDMWIGTFSIERAGGVLALIKAGLDVNVTAIAADVITPASIDEDADFVIQALSITNALDAGSLTVDGAVTVGDGIVVTCTTDSKSAIKATGGATAGDALELIGTGTGEGLVSNTVKVSGLTTLTGNVLLSGTTTCTGAVTLSSTLTTGAVTVASLSCTGQLDAGNVTVDANVLISGTTTCTGAVTLSSTLTTGAVTVASLSCTGQLDAGNLTIDGAVAVGTTTTLSGNVSCGAAFDVVGELSANSILVDVGTVLTGTVTTGAITAASFTSTGAFTVSDGIVVTCSTENKSAIKATGGATGGDGMELIGTGTGIDLNADITGNITGNVSGSVGTCAAATVSAIDNIDFGATMKASINTEVLDVFNTDTFAAPGDEAPTSTTTLVDKIGYLYKFLRNKIETTSTRIHVYDDAGSNKDHSSVISDDATTFTRGEFGAGD